MSMVCIVCFNICIGVADLLRPGIPLILCGRSRSLGFTIILRHGTIFQGILSEVSCGVVCKMAVKYKQKKIKGIRITEKIEGKRNRPLFPRAAVFRDKKAYDRKKEKAALRKEIGES